MKIKFKVKELEKLKINDENIKHIDYDYFIDPLNHDIVIDYAFWKGTDLELTYTQLTQLNTLLDNNHYN